MTTALFPHKRLPPIAVNRLMTHASPHLGAEFAGCSSCSPVALRKATFGSRPAFASSRKSSLSRICPALTLANQLGKYWNGLWCGRYIAGVSTTIEPSPGPKAVFSAQGLTAFHPSLYQAQESPAALSRSPILG